MKLKKLVIARRACWTTGRLRLGSPGALATYRHQKKILTAKEYGDSVDIFRGVRYAKSIHATWFHLVKRITGSSEYRRFAETTRLMVQAPSVRRTTQTVDRALSLLDVLAESRHPLNLSSISAKSGLNASTCLRLLRTLEEHQYIVRMPDSDLYRLGPKILSLSYALESQIDIRTVARPVLQHLSTVFGESAGLVIRQGNEGIVIERAVGAHALRHVQTIGHRGPLYCTSAGKVLLAWSDPDWQERYVSTEHLIRLTPATITSPNELREELERIRQQGYAIDQGEREEGLSAIAVPVHDAANRVVYAVGVSGPSERLPESVFPETIAELRAKAEEISVQLGWNAAPLETREQRPN